MSDADEARKARSLNNIEHHLKELVRVFVAFNENFVKLVQTFQESEVTIESETYGSGHDQMTLEDADKENGHDRGPTWQ